MLIQKNLEINMPINVKLKRERPLIPSYSKIDKIKEVLAEWNTIEDVELYKDLYEICSQLYLATYFKKLECLNYYTDIEYDNGQEITVYTAEIKDTWELPLKKRYKLHKDLLQRVMSNDITLVYSNNPKTQTEEDGQLTLFG